MKSEKRKKMKQEKEVEDNSNYGSHVLSWEITAKKATDVHPYRCTLVQYYYSHLCKININKYDDIPSFISGWAALPSFKDMRNTSIAKIVANDINLEALKRAIFDKIFVGN